MLPLSKCIFWQEAASCKLPDPTIRIMGIILALPQMWKAKLRNFMSFLFKVCVCVCVYVCDYMCIYVFLYLEKEQ